MNYLSAIFSEALRLHPPVPTDGKEAVVDDVFPSGLKIRAGDSAVYLPFVMGRHPDLWENPLIFDPKRWLDPQGKFRQDSPFRYPVFQAGPRQCLGKDFAYTEAKVMLVLLLQKYDIRIAVDPSTLKESQGLTMAILGGLPVYVTPYQYSK